jgi:uncharacterized protein YyaL (SSP411 family)
MFAASYGLAMIVHARRPIEVVVTGAEGDLAAYELERAAHQVFRLSKAVLRVTPAAVAAGALSASLAETLGHLPAGEPRAIVCVQNACQPPVSRPEELTALLAHAGAAIAAPS